MRIGREPALRFQLTPEVLEVLVSQPALDIGPGVDAGSGVPLEVNQITGVFVATAAKEVVEADLIERGAGGIGGDVSTNTALLAVGPHDHGHGVPADDALDSPFNLPAAGEYCLAIDGDGIDVGRIGREWDAHAMLLSPHLEPPEQLLHAFRPLVSIHVVKRFQPLLVFLLHFLCTTVEILLCHL